MAIEDFKHLIEAQSLEKTIKEHLDGISEQVNRVLHIEKQREIFSNETNLLTSELKEKTTIVASLENDLASAESKLEKTNEHIPLARNENEANALQTEVDTLTPRIELLQNQILGILEEIESLESTIKEKEEFLTGSAKSLKLISDEAEKEKSSHQEAIKSLEQRVSSLLEQAGENHRTAYLLSCQTHKFNNPLCFVSTGSCSVCRYTLNQMQANEIEKGIATESCPGCGRLLTPLSAKTL
ncbi:MAG: putative nucleic acid-binding Zn-ribbon protein [Bacteriovoracaceae bacterium]|jgi:predicted  nucleic acid-binding Zn-ribbon protein